MPYLHSDTEPFALRKADWKGDVLIRLMLKKANLFNDARQVILGVIAYHIQDMMVASKYQEDNLAPFLAAMEEITQNGMNISHRYLVPIIEYCAAFVLEERARQKEKGKEVKKRNKFTGLHKQSAYCEKMPEERKAVIFPIYDKIDDVFAAKTWEEASARLVALETVMQEQDIEMNGDEMYHFLFSCVIYNQIELCYGKPEQLYLRSELYPFVDADKEVGEKELQEFLDRKKEKDDVDPAFYALCGSVEQSIGGMKNLGLRYANQINHGFNVFTRQARTMRAQDFILLSEYCARHILNKKNEGDASFSFSYQKPVPSFLMKWIDPQAYDVKKQVKQHMEELMNAPNGEKASDALHSVEAVFRAESPCLTAKEAREFLLPCFCHCMALNNV